MPEIPNVVAGEPVESAWGNDIRDRTVQRYLDAAERDALTPIPKDGDLAYLSGSDELQIFTGGAWTNVALDGAVVYPLVVRTADGSITDPSWSFDNDRDTGIARFESGGFALVTNGIVNTRIQASRVRSEAIRDDTVGSAANVFIRDDDGRLQRSTVVTATLGDASTADTLTRDALEARMPGVASVSQLLDVIGHLLDRIEALEAP